VIDGQRPKFLLILFVCFLFSLWVRSTMAIATKGIVSVQQLNSPYREPRHSDCDRAQDRAQSEPADWFDVQRKAITSSQRSPQLFSWKLLFQKQVVFFWFSPSLQALLSCLFCRNTIYLCWGLPRQSSSALIARLKKWRLQSILKRSRVVLANDTQTLQELKKLGLADAKIFPYIVDANFFRFSAPTQRKNFLLVPGDNDRDEALIVALSAAVPYPIIRVTREQTVIDFYNNQPNANIEVRCQVSFSELLTLYQTAHSILLPIVSQTHAAGQTSILEALACGAPVLISKGRTSSIVNQYDSVTEIENNQVEAWCNAIEQTFDSPQAPHIYEQTANQIHRNHSIETVSAQLAEVMQWVGDTS